MDVRSLVCLSWLCATFVYAIDLHQKNLAPCTAATACTALTSLCTSCYSTLTDTVPKSGTVAAGDTHLYRISLCDGQSPFTITLQVAFGNPDMKVWNQPNISLAPTYESASKLNPTQTMPIAPDLGIREYTVGVANAGVFAAQYSVSFIITSRSLALGVTFPHTLNEGCNHIYECVIAAPNGTYPYNGTAPDQIQVFSESRGSSAYWPGAANSDFNLYVAPGQPVRPDVVTATPTLTNGLVGTARPGRALGYTVNGQRRLSGYPIKNEFTILSSSSEYQVGTNYATIQAKQGSVGQAKGCAMGYSLGGDFLTFPSGGAGSAHSVETCTSNAGCQADSDITTGGNWQCTSNQCFYRGLRLRNFVGDCATYCGSAAARALITCELVNVCTVAATDTTTNPVIPLGGGQLPDTVCRASHDCQSTSYLTDVMFKCDLYGQKSQAGGTGKCTFSFDQFSYLPIADFPGNWCSADSDCRQPFIRAGLRCAGPRIATVVREIKQLTYGALLQETVPYGTTKYYQLDRCNPNTPIDLHFTSQMKAIADIYISDTLLMSDMVAKMTHCSGQTCTCKVYRYNDPSPALESFYRIPGTSCQKNSDCTAINPARLTCQASASLCDASHCCFYCPLANPADCKAAESGWEARLKKVVGEKSVSFPAGKSLLCTTDASCVDYIRKTPVPGGTNTYTEARCVVQTATESPAVPLGTETGICRMKAVYGHGFLADTVCTKDSDCTTLNDDYFTCSTGKKCQFSFTTAAFRVDIPDWKNYQCETGSWGENTCKRPVIKNSIYCYGAVNSIKKVEFESKTYCATPPTALASSIRLPNTECSADSVCRDTSYIAAARFRCNLQLQTCEFLVNPDLEEWANLESGACTLDVECNNALRTTLVCIGGTGVCTAGKAYGDGTLWKVPNTQVAACQTDSNCQAASAEASISDSYMRCNKAAGNRCEMLIEAKDGAQKETTDANNKRVVIPFWTMPTTKLSGNLDKLGFCLDHAECYSTAARLARRCEKRFCRVSTKWGSAALPGTTCTRSSDCPAQLTYEKFKCTPATLNDPKGRCQFAADGITFTSTSYIDDWNAKAFSCGTDNDCRSEILLDSIWCDGDAPYEPNGNMESTTLYVAVSPKRSWDHASNAYQSIAAASTQLGMEFYDGIDKAANQQVVNYNQRVVAPVCYTNPPAVSMSGVPKISVYGRNFFYLRKDTLTFGGIVSAGSPDPKTKKWQQRPRCVFRTGAGFASCKTKDGLPLPGTVCTQDAHCLLQRSGLSTVAAPTSLLLPKSNFFCLKEANGDPEGKCHFNPGFCPDAAIEPCVPADVTPLGSVVCTDVNDPSECITKVVCTDVNDPSTCPTCDANLAPRCRIKGYTGVNGILPLSQCTVSSDCMDPNVNPPSSMVYDSGFCKYDSDTSNGAGEALLIPGVSASSTSQCQAHLTNLECIPETLRTDAIMVSDTEIQCQAPVAPGYTGTKPVFMGLEFEMAVDTLGQADLSATYVPYSPPLIARSYSVKKRIVGQAPAPPPVSSISCDNGDCSYSTAGTMDYYLANQKFNSVLPPLGPTNGGTQIVLNGVGFYDTMVGGAWIQTKAFVPNSGLAVQKGEYNVTGTGTGQLTMTTSAMPAGIYNLQVAVNAVDFEGMQPFEFLYYDPPTVSRVEPSSGTIAGGTIVGIFGTGFPYDDVNGSSYTRCRFKPPGTSGGIDNALVETTAASLVVPLAGNRYWLMCPTPRAAFPMTVDVDISFNLQDYSPAGRFEFTGTIASNGTCFQAVPSNFADQDCMKNSDCRFSVTYHQTATRCIGAPYCKMASALGSGALIGSDCKKASDCAALSASYFRCNAGACQWGMYSDFTNIPGAPPCTVDADCTQNADRRTCTAQQGICRVGSNYGGGVLIDSKCSTNDECIPGVVGVGDTTIASSDFACPVSAAECKYLSYGIPRLKEFGGSAVTTCSPAACQATAFFQSFWCDLHEVVTVVYPEYGPDIGGTVVTVSGSGFANASSLVCRFGLTPSCVDTTTSCPSWSRAGWCTATEHRAQMEAQCCRSCGFAHMLAPATFVSPTTVLCTSPNRTLVAATPGSPLSEGVDLEVSQNGQVFSDEGVRFNYYSSKINITRILPSLGPVTGNTSVKVWGGRMLNTMALQPIIKCKFGSLVVTGTWNSTAQNVVCVSPMMGNWTLPKAVTTLTTTGFITEHIPAMWYGKSGSYPLEVSFDDGQHYTSSGLTFRYIGDDRPRRVTERVDTTQVTSLNPNFGPRSGGTQVSVIGQNFFLQYTEDVGLWRIKFGSEYVPVSSYGPQNGTGTTYVMCVTLPDSQVPSFFSPFKQFPFEVPVEVSINDQQFSPDSIRFTYYEIPWVLNLLPTQGPAHGGTSVTVRGGETSELSGCPDPARAVECERASHHFLNLGASSCRFGTIQPPVESVFVKTGNITVINYTDPITNANTTRTYDSGYHVCISSKSSTPQSWTPASVVVDMAQNKQQFTGRPAAPSPFQLNGYPLNVYTYFRVPVSLYTLFPANGPTMGSTLVTVTGYNFTQSNEITCKFGEYRKGYFYQPLLGPGTWISSTKIKCMSPRANHTFDWATQQEVTVKTVATTFDVSMNTQEYTNWKLPYLYSVPVTDFQVTAIAPQFGPGVWSLQTGYGCCTTLNITGTGFQNTGAMTCKFAATFSDPAVQSTYYTGCTGPDDSCDAVAQTPITWISSTLLQCPTPQFSTAQWAQLSSKIIEVDISLNGQNYRRDDSSLTQYPYKTVTFYGNNAPLNCTPSAGPATGGTEVTITVASVLASDYSSWATCRWDKKYVTRASNTRFARTIKCKSPINEAGLTSKALPAVLPLEVAYNGQNYQDVALNYTFLGGTNVNPDDPTGTPIPNAVPGELVILSLTPSSGLTSANYAVTIRGNNFEGTNQYYVKFGSVRSPRVTKTGPTTLEAYPPPGQSAGIVRVYVSSNNQNFVDACHVEVGETSDHLINVGPCSKFNFLADPICYTCQSPNNPVTLSGVSVVPSLALAIMLFAALYILQNPGHELL